MKKRHENGIFTYKRKQTEQKRSMTAFSHAPQHIYVVFTIFLLSGKVTA